MLVPLVDLCTGLSILFLYHVLGKEKMSDNQRTKTDNSDFDTLKMNESDSQMRDRVYEIKMKENRAAQYHTTDCTAIVNSDIN